MSLLGPISPISSQIPLAHVIGPEKVPGADLRRLAAGAPATGAGTDFGAVLEGLIREVDGKRQTAEAATRSVLLGEGATLHESILARQEASLAFSLMIEVRNKAVEGYQELMRMTV
ncbi:flagellar hook-basal body complex protein FliE [Termitidicoccus mucosus]|uniref:Flagellar hook-basal body complex protein FliE n=1 Tax=Termitidicoccus mucosus TaxID=1184151 RepID=A0A178IHE7_9BACT|nr:hypothetical protein AW736_16260 [Opitutaceae bacterium TSB47]